MSTVSVRYMVDDVDAAIAFYTTHLGFALQTDARPAFASVTRGDLRLLLSGKASSGARPMPDGRQPVPGGWNRIQLQTDGLDAAVDGLRSAGARFRTDVIEGVGVRQVVVEDPSGNPVELFEPLRPEAGLDRG
ncbi:MAG TPA: VOC family protein [Sorangium sp.]|nr:VOC family protein [Sorangium sp.]